MKRTRILFATTAHSAAPLRGRLLLAALALICFGTATASAKVFVSFRGQFYFQYPDDWTQTDFRTVDYYLQQADVALEMLDYEALLSDREGGSFAEGVYLILTVDTVGELNESEIDSLLKDLGGASGERPRDVPLADFMAELDADAPVYDPESRTISIVTDITEDLEAIKKSLLVMKFYERGIANFYFYAPDSMFEQSTPVFAAIIGSFSTENLEAAIPREDLKVADLEATKKRGVSRIIWPVVVLLLVVATVILVKRRGSSKRLAEERREEL